MVEESLADFTEHLTSAAVFAHLGCQRQRKARKVLLHVLEFMSMSDVSYRIGISEESLSALMNNIPSLTERMGLSLDTLSTLLNKSKAPGGLMATEKDLLEEEHFSSSESMDEPT